MSIATAIATMMESDFDAIQPDYAGSLVYDGVTVAGTQSPVNEALSADMEGVVFGADSQWAGKISDFSGKTVPTEKKIVTLDGVRHHVLNTTNDGVIVTLFLKRVELR